MFDDEQVNAVENSFSVEKKRNRMLKQWCSVPKIVLNFKQNTVWFKKRGKRKYISTDNSVD